MTRMWIVMGDPTTSGGTVITGSPFSDIDGKPIARVADQATCPLHEGTFPIVDGDSTTMIDGQVVALHGSSLACGCKVLAIKQMRVFLDAGAGDAAGAGATSKGLKPYEPSTPAAKAGANAPAALAITTLSAASTVKPQSASQSLEPAANDNPAYDEQIKFVGPTGAVLTNIEYVLHLADGSKVNGVTDEDGRTQRIVTPSPLDITKAELLAPKQASGCCGPIGLPSQTVELALTGASTNPNQVGSSVHQAETKAEDRSLTSGEIAMLRQVFGDAVNYTSVKIHNHGYWLLFGFQPDNTATAPNGQIYLPGQLFRQDFSTQSNDRAQLFVHEMTHVWQYQLGYPVKRVRGVRPNMTYGYTIDGRKRLCNYNMEAQGNIIADYFLLKVRQGGEDLYERKYRGQPHLLAVYEATLRDFLIQPGDMSNLPKVTE